MKCVSIDLDGTLLDTNHQISLENEIVIKQLKQKGIEVILNTGRQYQDVIKLPAVKNINCPIFCLNGSTLYSSEGELIYETNLSVAIYEELLATLKQLDVGILVYTNMGGYPATLPQLRNKTIDQIYELFASQDYDSIPQINNIKIYKIIAWVETDKIEKINQLRKILQQKTEISCSSSFPNNLEITAAEAEKGKAIRRYEQLNNLTFSEIYSFGDGGNDLSAFEISTASFAMENAPDAIKKAATYVTKSNNDNGVAFAIKHYLKLV